MDKRLITKIHKLQKQAANEPVTIALDWLSIYFTQSGHFYEKIEEGDNQKLSDNCYLVAVDRPTLHFNSMFTVVLNGEEVACLLLNSRNVKFFEKNTVKLEVKNHALYSGAWIEVITNLKEFGLQYKSCGRIDIAIDGMNAMHQLLNLYAKQNISNKTLQLKNSSESRARFSAKVLNPNTMLFENFNIGGNGGNKMITVYNKTLELVKSGKKYIQEFWLRNGIIGDTADLDIQAIELEKWEAKGFETFHLEGYRNIYRFEIRLKSESIKEIEGFTLDMITTAEGLASIVKLHCKKFFEPIFCDDPKPSFCKPVNIIPFEKLGATRLDKITRVETDGMYKAKITMHGLIQDLYRNRIETEKIPDCIAAIMDRVERYRLAYYLDNKLDEWERRYYHSTPENDRPKVEAAMTELLTRLFPHLQQGHRNKIDLQTYLVETLQGKGFKKAQKKEAEKLRQKKKENEAKKILKIIKELETVELGARHNQADATAAFGEN